MDATLEMPVAATSPGIVKPPKRRILLADDDPAVGQVLLHLLAEENFLVLTAANGIEALELAADTKLDLALLDLNAPGEDGWKTFAQLSIKNSLLPVILITDRSDRFFNALASGVSALLEKPLDFVKLFHTIHRLLDEPAEARRAGDAGRFPVFC